MSEAASDLLDQPIASLVRAGTVRHDILIASHITTIRALVGMTKQDLKRYPNWGAVSVAELEQRLTELGLELANRPAKDGTLPLPFPSLHERLTRIEQRLDALERHPLLREVGQMGGMTPHQP
jgi:hypothetical protein